MNTSVASVDSVVLESAMALQADDEFQASVTVDDTENLLIGLPSSSTVNISDQQAEQVELALPLEIAQSPSAHGTISKPILAEIFPFQNTLSLQTLKPMFYPIPSHMFVRKARIPENLTTNFWS